MCVCACVRACVASNLAMEEVPLRREVEGVVAQVHWGVVPQGSGLVQLEGEGGLLAEEVRHLRKISQHH